ncbi:MAG: hypothetical protein ACRDT6_25365 [Micromonosporaceae bacterium]
MRRTIAAGAAVFAAVTMALTGCGGDPDPTVGGKPTPSAEKSRSAPALLAQSYRKIEGESFRFTSTMTVDDVAITTEGAFDPAGKVGTATLDLAGQEMELRILGKDMYVEVLGQWLHLDMDKLPAGSTFADAGNPVGNAEYLLSASDDVKQTGKGTYQGTLDLRRYAEQHATPEEAKELEETLKELGPEARKVPFTATVDDAGRLTSLATSMKITAEGRKSTVVQKIAFSDFGTKVSVAEPPADKIQEGPSSMYEK